MQLVDFVNQVTEFPKLSHMEKVKHFGWFLHVYQGKDWFTSSDVKQCFVLLHLEVPNVSDVLAKLSDRKPKIMLRSGHQYKLELQSRQVLDTRYANRPISIAVEQSLAALPPRLTDETKRKYLVEALDCYRVRCYRASILMTWNLAYDHLVNWLLADSSRLARFNTKLPGKPPFSTGMIISKREDFEWLKESETIEICGHKDVAIIPTNLLKILRQSLEWRNMAAHPTTIEIKQVNAEHTISSLVENIVLRLV